MKKFLYTREGVCILVRIDPICIDLLMKYFYSSTSLRASTLPASKEPLDNMVIRTATAFLLLPGIT